MNSLEIKFNSYEMLLNELINNVINVVEYKTGIELLKDGSKVWFIPDYMQVHEREDHCYVTMGAYSNVETFGIKFYPNSLGKLVYSW